MLSTLYFFSNRRQACNVEENEILVEVVDDHDHDHGLGPDQVTSMRPCSN